MIKRLLTRGERAAWPRFSATASVRRILVAAGSRQCRGQPVNRMGQLPLVAGIHRLSGRAPRRKSIVDTGRGCSGTAQSDPPAAVEGWEASIRTRDPDYAQMSEAVRLNAQRLHAPHKRGWRTCRQPMKRSSASRGELPYLELDAIPAPDTDQLLPRAAVPAVRFHPIGRSASFPGCPALLLVSLLPSAIVTVIGWIITSRWRAGPYW